MRLALAPVEVQVLGQEATPAISRARLCIQPVASSWRIAGVDDRDSRCGPSRQASSSSASSSHSRRVVARAGARGARCAGGGAARARRSRATRAGARTRRRPRRRARAARCSSSRGETQPKCRYGESSEVPPASRSWRSCVAVEARRAASARSAPAPGRLARRERVGASGSGAAGRRPTAQAGRRRASARGAPCTSRRGELLPARGGTGVKTRVRAAVLRARPADVGDEVARAGGGPRRRRRAAPPRRAGRAPSRTARRRRRSRPRSAPVSARERRQHLLGPARAHDEVGAALAQRVAQLAQAAEQEPRAVARTGSARVEQPRVEHEDRHDAVGLAVRGGERGVVVDAQVAPEPDEGGRGHRRGYGRRPGRT